MSKKLKRKLLRRKSKTQILAEAIVDLADMSGCQSLKEVETAFWLAGYELDQKYFSQLPPLPELRELVRQRKPVPHGKRR